MRLPYFALSLAAILNGCEDDPYAENVLIPSSPSSESVVPFDADGFLAGSMVADGTVTMYGSDGKASKSWTPIAGLVMPRGLAISGDGQLLWVADNRGVSQYSLSQTGAAFERLYATEAAGSPEPNGLCLNSDETKLFATQPGWKLKPYGPAGTNALVQIDLETKTVTSLFRNEPGHSPNGCFVEGDIVWMVGQKDGITSYNLTTGTASGTPEWSQQLKDYQTSTESVGDGLVLYGNAFYASSWNTGGGLIHKLGPTVEMDTFANVAAADLQLDLRDGQAALLAPDLRAGRTLKFKLENVLAMW